MSDEEVTPGGCLVAIILIAVVMLIYWAAVESNPQTVTGTITNKYQEPDPEATFTSLYSLAVETEPGETRILRTDSGVYHVVHAGERYEFRVNGVSRIRTYKKLDKVD